MKAYLEKRIIVEYLLKITINEVKRKVYKIEAEWLNCHYLWDQKYENYKFSYRDRF